MEINQPLIYKDTENRFICRQIPINEENKEITSRIKSYIKEGFEKAGYEGYSYEFDSYFDPYSNYFYVEDKTGRILATARITDKTKDNLIPFEMGLKDDGTKYKLDEEVHVGDINSFVFSSFRALPLLYAVTGKFAHLMGMKKGFCLLDESSVRIKKIYLGAGFKYSEKYKDKIYFPTFGKTEKGIFKPTYWSIMEIDYDTILQHSRSADNYLKISE
jgi:hypothetical protein